MLSQRIIAVPDLCCIVTQSLFKLVGGVFVPLMEGLLVPCHVHDTSLLGVQQYLSMTV